MWAHLTDPGVLEATLVVLSHHVTGPAPGDPGRPRRLHLPYATAPWWNRSTWPGGRRPRAGGAGGSTERGDSGRFAGAAIGIGIADMRGQIIEVNQAFAEMLGYSTQRCGTCDCPICAIPRIHRALAEY